jgi:hypothetical protein
MFGGLRDVSGGRTLPLLVTAGIMAVLAVRGVLAGRDRVISGSQAKYIGTVERGRGGKFGQRR